MKQEWKGLVYSKYFLSDVMYLIGLGVYLSLIQTLKWDILCFSEYNKPHLFPKTDAFKIRMELISGS